MPAPKPASRVAQAAEVLRQEVLSKGPGTRLSSVRELKARLGFSQASLASAFEQLEREGLIVRRHGSGVYASAESDQVRVAVVLDPKFLLMANRSPIWNLILKAICKASGEKGWAATVHLGAIWPKVSGYDSLSPEALPSALIEDLNNHRVNAAVCIGLSQGAVNVVTEAGVPVVSLAGYGQGIVQFHHRDLLQQGLQSLKGKGAAKVYVAASRLADLENLEEFAQEYGLEAERVLLGEEEPVEQPLESSDPVHQGWQWAGTLELKPGVAILSCDDMLTVGILMALHSRGLVPGRDVLIVSHSNKGSSTLTGWHQSLTRLEYNPVEISEALLKLVDQIVTHGSWAEVENHWPPTEKEPETGELVYRISPTLIEPD